MLGRVSFRSSPKLHVGRELAFRSSARVSKLPQTVNLKVCHRDGCYPLSRPQMPGKDRVYTTPNVEVQVRYRGKWVEVQNPRMDCVVIFRDGRFMTWKQVELCRGDQVVCGHHEDLTTGIRVKPQPRGKEDKRTRFGFHGTPGIETAPNKMIHPYVWTLVKNYREGRMNTWIIGPALIHLGLQERFSKLMELGLVDLVFTNTATITHDAETTFFGSALGACQQRDGGEKRVVDTGPSHHLWAGNQLRFYGGVREAVRKRKLTRGLFYELETRQIPWLAAESLRDDVTQVEVVQLGARARHAHMEVIDLMVQGNALGDMTVLASQLHGIGIGNLTPQTGHSTFHVVDADRNFIDKIGNRGTTQARGFNLHLDHFLRVVQEEIEALPSAVLAQLQGPRIGLYERLGIPQKIGELTAANKRFIESL